MENRVRELELLLESLTPGGSEFAGDPERCASYIRKRMQSVTEQVQRRKKAEKRLRELEHKYLL